MSLISLRSISKTVDGKHQKVPILRGINLDIQLGQFVTIMGPSGSGKSTLLNILGLLEEPTSGEYFFKDEAVHGFGARRRAELHKHEIGFVFQAYHLIDELTVYENIETPLQYKGIKSAERKAMVADVLDRFNMVAKKDLFPEQLSGGQQQLVGIARAIIAKPSLLLADEPTGNLHSEQGKLIMQLFAQLNREEGVTIVQVTHAEENARYGNRIVHLMDGAMVREESVAAPIR